MHERLTRRISLVIATLSAWVGAVNFCFGLVSFEFNLWENFAQPQVWTLFLYAAIFGLSHYWDQRLLRWAQVLLILVLSGPVLVSTTYAFFGFWFTIFGTTLLYKYGFLARGGVWKLLIVTLWFLGWIGFSLISNNSLSGSLLQGINYAAFLIACFASLYFLFEEEIRDLLASNKSKDAALADQAAEIARLEPLSVLGQRVAHVAHSFKNNLNQISTTLFLLEQGNDPLRAAAKLREFSNTLNERIENILMVSRAGVDLKAETFDLARVLEGIKHVYLQEQGFLSKAKTTLDLEGSVLVHMVRWDFLLMAENILKNALEAISEKGVFGAIRIELTRGSLKFSNNGSPMPLCRDCEADCLNCPRYGQPGRTTKKTGSGHGLAQVFATCRAMKWTLKIRSDGEWTTFDIGLPAS